tara:strand:- start:16139 stop:17029 length:891 start_codon:yes stop_codon:yes gene_type:complete
LNLSCKICKRESSHSSLNPKLIFCKKCDIHSTVLPEIDDAYETGNYASYKTSFFEKLIIRINDSYARISMIGKFNGTWLDFGCGKGHFLASLPKNLIKYGWETNKERAEFSRERNSNTIIIENFFGEATSIDNKKFDMISLFHVLEHLEDPIIVINLFKKHLAPKGMAIVEVPNYKSLQARFAKENWLHLDIPNHRTHWSKESLIAFFKDHDFRVVKISQVSFTEGIFGMADSIFFSKSDNRIYSRLKGNFFKKILILPIILFSLILELLACLIGSGGVNRVLITRDISMRELNNV